MSLKFQSELNLFRQDEWHVDVRLDAFQYIRPPYGLSYEINYRIARQSQEIRIEIDCVHSASFHRAR